MRYVKHSTIHRTLEKSLFRLCSGNEDAESEFVRVWQAVLFQDTFLTVILKLPPTATHTDVRVEDLVLEGEESLTESGATGKQIFHINYALFTSPLEARSSRI